MDTITDTNNSDRYSNEIWGDPFAKITEDDFRPIEEVIAEQLIPARTAFAEGDEPRTRHIVMEIIQRYGEVAVLYTNAIYSFADEVETQSPRLSAFLKKLLNACKASNADGRSSERRDQLIAQCQREEEVREQLRQEYYRGHREAWNEIFRIAETCYNCYLNGQQDQ